MIFSSLNYFFPLRSRSKSSWTFKTVYVFFNIFLIQFEAFSHMPIDYIFRFWFALRNTYLLSLKWCCCIIHFSFRFFDTIKVKQKTDKANTLIFTFIKMLYFSVKNKCWYSKNNLSCKRLPNILGYEALQIAKNVNDVRTKIEVIPLLSQALLLISRYDAFLNLINSFMFKSLFICRWGILQSKTCK